MKCSWPGWAALFASLGFSSQYRRLWYSHCRTQRPGTVNWARILWKWNDRQSSLVSTQCYCACSRNSLNKSFLIGKWKSNSYWTNPGCGNKSRPKFPGRPVFCRAACYIVSSGISCGWKYRPGLKSRPASNYYSWTISFWGPCRLAGYWNSRFFFLKCFKRRICFARCWLFKKSPTGNGTSSRSVYKDRLKTGNF